MIKATLNTGVLLLGLSAENITRLKQGMPIHIKKEDGWPTEIIIVYGETEQAMVDQLGLNEMINPH
jgi:hypothetical protein